MSTFSILLTIVINNDWKRPRKLAMTAFKIKFGLACLQLLKQYDKCRKTFSVFCVFIAMMIVEIYNNIIHLHINRYSVYGDFLKRSVL